MVPTALSQNFITSVSISKTFGIAPVAWICKISKMAAIKYELLIKANNSTLYYILLYLYVYIQPQSMFVCLCVSILFMIYLFVHKILGILVSSEFSTYVFLVKLNVNRKISLLF